MKFKDSEFMGILKAKPVCMLLNQNILVENIDFNSPP